MPTYLLPYDEWDFTAEIFAFDADISESRDDSWRWTKYAIESGAEVSDFAVEEPRRYELKGICTAALATSDEEVVTRLPQIHDALVAYALTRQPVTIVCGTWLDDVVVLKVSARKDQSTGEALEIAISLQSYQIAEYITVEIPPELLAPAVKAGATADTGETEAGAGTESPPPPDDETFDPSSKTAAAALYDGDNPYDAFSAGLDTVST